MPMFEPSLKKCSSDRKKGGLDLEQYVTYHPDATFFMKYTGFDLEDIAIFHDDVLVVDRSIEPNQNSTVIAVINEEFKIEKFKNLEKLKKEADSENIYWGTVTYTIHKL